MRSAMTKRKWENTPAGNDSYTWTMFQQSGHIKHKWNQTKLHQHKLSVLAVLSSCLSRWWHWCFNNVKPPHVFEFLHQLGPHPYPNSRPLIQTLVIWPAVAWLMEWQATLLIPSATFKPHSDIDSKPCYSPLPTYSAVLVVMFNIK